MVDGYNESYHSRHQAEHHVNINKENEAEVWAQSNIFQKNQSQNATKIKFKFAEEEIWFT